MEAPKVYLESSVISYLAARERPNRDIIATAHQQITREWWERRRKNFELYVSVEVLNEIRRGNVDSAAPRLTRVCEVLQQAGADPSIADNSGRSPQQIAEQFLVFGNPTFERLAGERRGKNKKRRR